MTQQDSDYLLGQAFGRIAKEQVQRHPSRLKAVIADLLGSDHSLRAPLRELVELPAFLEADPLVDSASSRALVSVLLDELRPVFRDETLVRLHEVLRGYFTLVEAKETRPADAFLTKQSANQDEEVFNQKSEYSRDPQSQDSDNHYPNEQKRNHKELKLLPQTDRWSKAEKRTAFIINLLYFLAIASTTLAMLAGANTREECSSYHPTFRLICYATKIPSGLLN